MKKARKKNLIESNDLIRTLVYSGRLDNGLRVVNDYLPAQRSFALGLCINVGSRDDFSGASGLSHFMEHILFKRTKRRTGRQISTQFENLGAYFNAYTTKEYTCFYVRALNEHFEKSLDLLVDVVTNPRFKIDDVRSERSVILEEIRSYDEDPEESIFDVADKQMFSGNQLEHPIAGYEKELKKIKIEHLEKFHSEFYVPSNITLSVSGSIEQKDVMDQAERALGAFMTTTSTPNRERPAFIKPVRNEIKSQYNQTHLLYSVRTEGLDSEEKYALSVMNILFGEGMSSRLNLALRERHGLAYNIYTNLHLLSDVGQFMIYSATEPKKAEKLERLLNEELEKVLDKKITNPEIFRAKEQLKTGMVIDLESLTNRMQNVAKNEMLFGKHDAPDSTISKIDEVDKNELIALADKYFKKDNWHISVFREGE